MWLGAPYDGQNDSVNKQSETSPNEVSAVFSSLRSIDPELSRSKLRKQFCQSVTYFHRAWNSWKSIAPDCLRSNMPTRHTTRLHFNHSVTTQNKPTAITTDSKPVAVIMSTAFSVIHCRLYIVEHLSTLCPKKTTLMLHTIDSTHINRFR